MHYHLAVLARRRTRRKTIVLRPIEVTGVLDQDLYRIVRDVPAGWEIQIEAVLSAYEMALPGLVRDDIGDQLRHALEIAVAAGTRIIVALNPRIRAWLARIDSWHAQRWSAAVKAGTGVEVFPFLDLDANRIEIQAMQARIASLIKGLDDEMRKAVEDAVWRGFLAHTPRREMAKELRGRIEIGRRRALLIAADQANKTAAALMKSRQQEAGIEMFVWETAKDDRVRPEHAALQGKRFRWDAPPSIGLPGTPIRCRCTGRAYVELEDEAA